MNVNRIKPGMRVKTAAVLGAPGMGIVTTYVFGRGISGLRKPNTTGHVVEYVKDLCGDVWWVQHDDTQEVAPYCFTELEPCD